jgi:hypothetical protein
MKVTPSMRVPIPAGAYHLLLNTMRHCNKLAVPIIMIILSAVAGRVMAQDYTLIHSCEEVQKKLLSSKWSNPNDPTHLVNSFQETGPLSGRRTAYFGHGPVTVDYELKPTQLPYFGQVCQFEQFYPFSHASCAGDVWGYFVGAVGPELTFLTQLSLRVGGGRFEPTPEKHIVKCPNGYEDFTFAPWP